MWRWRILGGLLGVLLAVLVIAGVREVSPPRPAFAEFSMSERRVTERLSVRHLATQQNAPATFPRLRALGGGERTCVWTRVTNTGPQDGTWLWENVTVVAFAGEPGSGVEQLEPLGEPELRWDRATSGDLVRSESAELRHCYAGVPPGTEAFDVAIGIDGTLVRHTLTLDRSEWYR